MMFYYITPKPMFQAQYDTQSRTYPPGLFIPNSITLPLGIMPPPGLEHPDGYMEIINPIHNSIILPSGSSVSNEYLVKIFFGFIIVRKNIYDQNLAILHNQIGMVTKDLLTKHIENFDLLQLLEFTNRYDSLQEIKQIGFNPIALEIIVRLIIISYFEWLNIGGKFKTTLFANLSKYINLTEKFKRDIIAICVIFNVLKY